jgi:hypothetical protein
MPIEHLLDVTRYIQHSDLELELLRKIAEAKRRWPNIFLLKLQLPMSYTRDAKPYYALIRPMTRAEAESFYGVTNSGFKFDRFALIGQCILHPSTNILDIPAGYVDSCLDIIEEISGWRSPEDLGLLQNAGRARINGDTANIPSFLDMFIMSVFKAVRPEDTMNMDAFQSMELLSMTEKIMERDIPINPKKVPKRLYPLKASNDFNPKPARQPNKK